MQQDDYREAGRLRDALLMQKAASAPPPAPDGKKGAEEETMKAGKLLVLCATVSEQETIPPLRRTARTLPVDGAYLWCQGLNEAPAELGRTMSDGTHSRRHGLCDGDSATFRESLRASLSPSDRIHRRLISVDGAPVRASSGPERDTVEEFIHSATRNFTRGPAFISSAKKHLPPTGAGSTPTSLHPSSWAGNTESDFRRTRSDVPPSLHEHLPLTPGTGSRPTSLRPSSWAGIEIRRTQSGPSAGNSVFEIRRTRSAGLPTLHVQSLRRQDIRLNVHSELAWVRHSLRRESLVRQDGVLLGAAGHGLVIL